jgi:hypothetical protein
VQKWYDEEDLSYVHCNEPISTSGHDKNSELSKLMKVNFTLGKVLRQMKTVNLGKRFVVKTDSSGQQKNVEEVPCSVLEVFRFRGSCCLHHHP